MLLQKLFILKKQNNHNTVKIKSTVLDNNAAETSITYEIIVIWLHRRVCRTKNRSKSHSKCIILPVNKILQIFHVSHITLIPFTTRAPHNKQANRQLTNHEKTETPLDILVCVQQKPYLSVVPCCLNQSVK